MDWRWFLVNLSCDDMDSAFGLRNLAGGLFGLSPGAAAGGFDEEAVAGVESGAGG